METHTMFRNWKAQKSKDIDFPQTDTQVWHNFYQHFSQIFIDKDKIILKLIWKGKENRIVKTILKKKNKVGVHGSMKQNPEIDPHGFAQLEFDEDQFKEFAQSVQWRKDNIFQNDTGAWIFAGKGLPTLT